MKTTHRILLLSLVLAVLFIQCEKEDPFVKITDNNFLNALIELGIDTDGDGQISDEEAEVVISLDVSEDSISDMTGIEKFINLDTLRCVHNQITSLDLTSNTALTMLDCGRNRLTSLDVYNCADLRFLDCYINQLTTLDVSNNNALNYLACDYNQLTSLDVSNNSALSILSCRINQLTTLYVSNNPALVALFFSHNQLSTLDVSKNVALESLLCSQNQLSTLDLSNQPDLIVLECYSNQLSSLDVSNNMLLKLLLLGDMPTLEEVCVWTLPFPPEGVDVDTTGSPNVYFTSECSN